MNEIEFTNGLPDYREIEAANADDASSIRARATPPANEASASNARAVPRNPETGLDEATQARMKKIRETSRKKYEGGLRPDTSADEGVQPAAGLGKPIGSTGNSNNSNMSGNAIRPKPIFEKSGYDIPKSVSDRYVAFEGKYLDRKSEAVHFEDKGRSLATASEDRDVIAHMVAVAQAKHWGELQLKGSEEFRRQAWIAAELADMPTRGFKPDAQDRAMLQAAREAMRIATGERSATLDPARTNTVEATPVNGPKQHQPDQPGQPGDSRKAVTVEAPGEDTSGPGGASPGGGRRRRSPRPSKPGPAGSQPSASSEAKTAPEGPDQAQLPLDTGSMPSQQTSTRTPSRTAPRTASGEAARKKAGPGTQKPPTVTAGVLVEHGAARFHHDPKENASYYATVRTESGDRTVWGLDLERAIGESGLQPGQRIELERGGSKVVTVTQRQFDESGKELAPKEVESRRNEWRVSSPDVPGMPTREQRAEIEAMRREVDERRRIKEARERFLNDEWQYTKAQQATLDAARERIKEQAAREVLEDEIRGLPDEQQEQLRGEFESAVAEARADNRPLNVPMPQVSEATIQAMREQIVRERAGQSVRQQQNDADHGQQQPTHEAGHDAPTLEIDP
ncbi:LPD7 domain-containing protein [Paraburkholderia phymatum]|uniref:LPD7 domain-containing protein n=1 Tax=Paraburkholderia phymatum TaxID=148447 RepID=UPI0031820063